MKLPRHLQEIAEMEKAQSFAVAHNSARLFTNPPEPSSLWSNMQAQKAKDQARIKAAFETEMRRLPRFKNFHVRLVICEVESYAKELKRDYGDFCKVAFSLSDKTCYIVYKPARHGYGPKHKTVSLNPTEPPRLPEFLEQLFTKTKIVKTFNTNIIKGSQLITYNHMSGALEIISGTRRRFKEKSVDTPSQNSLS